MSNRPRIGISKCLLGEAVRYNGGHKLDSYIKYNLGEYVDFVEFCPELEAGFGVPREAVQLHERGEKTLMLGQHSSKDFTGLMNTWLDKSVPGIVGLNLDGFILKSKSPSCGIYRTRSYREGLAPNLNSSGLFARRLKELNPLLVMEEEGRLHDPVIRDNFVSRIFINQMWREVLDDVSVSRVMKFQEVMKYTLMSHSPKLQKEMGSLVAGFSPDSLPDGVKEYYALLCECLSIYVTKKSNRNVLDHIMGYFKRDLDGDEKKELKEVIEHYVNGVVPLIVPVTLLYHYVRKYDEKYLKRQFFLNPHPLELMLRNSI